MLRPLPSLLGFSDALTHANVDVKALVADEKGTVCSPSDVISATAPALTVLVGEGLSEIMVKRSLSRGGMGEILLAEQLSLGREVAVKITAPGKGGTRAHAELIVEARVAGQLEHPNIVPIHILGQTSDGEPLIVMKRIDGESWSALIKRGRQLSRDVDILMDVCRALYFAHARGVVHRDVKPANVMVGLFGEVYLLDWGIAVGFGDRTLADLPLAHEVTGVAGTPRYMAPEMAIPGGGIDQRTDVFLVGAVLHELLKGVAPYPGKDIEEVLFAAHTAAEPTFAPDVDEELASICRKAMKRDPVERYQSVDEIRLALAAFQSHAAARELSRAAEERLEALLAMPRGAEAVDVQRAFTECRFGFTQALRAWPESARAHGGLERALVVMAVREAEAGHYDSARLLASELSRVPSELTTALEALARKRDDEAKHIEQLHRVAHDQDMSIGLRERSLLVFGTSLLWMSFLVVLHVLAAKGIYVAKSGTFAIVLSPVALAVGAAGVLFERVRGNAASRTMYLSLLWCITGTTLVHALGWHFDVEPAPALAMAHMIIALTVFFSSAQDGRLWPAALLALLIVPAIAALPSAAFIVSGLGTIITAVAVVTLIGRAALTER